MLTTTEDHPLARQLAEEWLAVLPDGNFCCFGCHKMVPITRHPDMDIVCPLCGWQPDDIFCKRALRHIAEKRAAAALVPAIVEAAQAEPEAPPRGAPPGLDDVIGNKSAVGQIRIFLEAHRARLKDNPKLPFPHILLSGSGGLGKSMLAKIVAHELKHRFVYQLGQSLNNPRKVGELLLSLKALDVLFIDEIHGLSKPCQETLYLAMEDGFMVPITKAGTPPGKPIRLPPFTLIGGTTDIWGLNEPLGQRFKYHIKLRRLTTQELADAMMQRAKRAGLELDAEAAMVIGERAHGTPRLAIRLFESSMDVAKAGGENKVDAFIVHRACELLEIDALGLDDEARRYLKYLDESNGPVRVNVLASKLDGLSRLTVERRIEPDLVFLGLIVKKEKGRCLTAAGKDHLEKAH